MMITRAARVVWRRTAQGAPQVHQADHGDGQSHPQHRFPGAEKCAQHQGESEVKEYKHWQRRRLSVRPGITCLWQAYHRDERDFEKWTKTDLEYVDSWSLWQDFKIFMRTMLTVITGKGAY